MTQRLAEILDNPEEALTSLQRRRLKPLGPVSRCIRRLLETLNRLLVPLAFDVSVEGMSHLPRRGPYLIAPNHSSSLDSFLLAATLPHDVLEQARWAGSREALLRNWLRRSVNRLARAIPLSRSSRALAVGAAVLRQQGVLVWFPEGRRTRDGHLQKLKPGIGILAAHFQVPVVPVWIEGAYQALRPGGWVPRFRRPIQVRFGAPIPAPEPGPAASPDGEERSGERGDARRGKQLIRRLRRDLLDLRDEARNATTG